MIVKKVRYYSRLINKNLDSFGGDRQEIKNTSYLLFGFIPLFINSVAVGGKLLEYKF